MREVQLCITTVADGDGLHGWIRRGCEPATGFTGWLGLISRLDQLLSVPPAVGETSSAETPPTHPSGT